MFASFYVLQNMYRVWNRKCTLGSFVRNIFFMILLLYMVILNFLSFIIVGSMYAAFSLFIRILLDYSPCPDIFAPANLVENCYLIVLASILLISTTVKIDGAESSFRATSFLMG